MGTLRTMTLPADQNVIATTAAVSPRVDRPLEVVPTGAFTGSPYDPSFPNRRTMRTPHVRPVRRFERGERDRTGGVSAAR